MAHCHSRVPSRPIIRRIAWAMGIAFDPVLIKARCSIRTRILARWLARWSVVLGVRHLRSLLPIMAFLLY